MYRIRANMVEDNEEEKEDDWEAQPFGGVWTDCQRGYQRGPVVMEDSEPTRGDRGGRRGRNPSGGARQVQHREGTEAFGICGRVAKGGQRVVPDLEESFVPKPEDR